MYVCMYGKWIGPQMISIWYENDTNENAYIGMTSLNMIFWSYNYLQPLKNPTLKN